MPNASRKHTVSLRRHGSNRTRKASVTQALSETERLETASPNVCARPDRTSKSQAEWANQNRSQAERKKLLESASRNRNVGQRRKTVGVA
jgi:hypothetical protein